MTTRAAVFTYAHISLIHTARRMVSGIKMPVHMPDANCSLFLLIIRLPVFAVCDDQVIADYVKFLLVTGGRFNLTLARVIPCEYCHKWYTAKRHVFGLHFHCRKHWCIFNYFYIICPESYWIWWNYAAVRAITVRCSRSSKVTEFGKN